MTREYILRDLINEVDTAIDVMNQNELHASAFLSASRLEDTYKAGHFEKTFGASFAEQCPNAKIALEHGPDFT